MPGYCSICGRPKSDHLPADNAPEQRRRHGRRGATRRLGGRTLSLPVTARLCPVVAGERDGRTVWRAG